MKMHGTLAERFASKIARERAKRKLSQGAFAKILGVAAPYVHQLEHGQRVPSLEMVDQIAKKLGYSNAVEILK
jgi:transcriptional regulator with XRE-family HTH domain